MAVGSLRRNMRMLCLTDASSESNSVCAFFFQLLGLKACHDRNITHRDIKPGKKLFDDNG